jgi:hypothetical protein
MIPEARRYHLYVYLCTCICPAESHHKETLLVIDCRRRDRTRTTSYVLVEERTKTTYIGYLGFAGHFVTSLSHHGVLACLWTRADRVNRSAGCNTRLSECQLVVTSPWPEALPNLKPSVVLP